MSRHKKVAGNYAILSKILSVLLSYVGPSAPHHSYPLHNYDTVRDVFAKLSTNINHHQKMCREQ